MSDLDLTQDEIATILWKPEPKRRVSVDKAKVPKAYSAPPQYGPLRFLEHEAKCNSRNCGSPTYVKVDGMTYCTMHALRYLNDVVHKFREQRA